MTKDNLNIKTLVREPIDDINKKIRIYKNKSIILSGPRGCGKTTVLKDLEQSGLGRFEQYIYTTFEGTGLYLLKPGKNFDVNFLEHYYEVLMSYKILEYIKKYYGLTYKKEFQEDGIVIKEL